MFRLCDKEMYTAMDKNTESLVIDRGMALHKMLRLITMTLGGEGYLTFMGNEFGHPEWIDFPREGNGWSYFYCRRQWHLADDESLRYGELLEFDRAMLSLSQEKRLFRRAPKGLRIDDGAQVLVYERGGVVFALNFSPSNAYVDYELPVPSVGRYQVVLSTDEGRFGGWDRISKEYVYTAERGKDKKTKIRIYLPARTALCMVKLK
jgi:1,4-alpha-glucan branching enzyme